MGLWPLPGRQEVGGPTEVPKKWPLRLEVEELCGSSVKYKTCCGNFTCSRWRPFSLTFVLQS